MCEKPRTYFDTTQAIVTMCDSQAPISFSCLQSVGNSISSGANTVVDSARQGIVEVANQTVNELSGVRP